MQTILDVWNIFDSSEKTSIDDTIVAGYGNQVRHIEQMLQNIATRSEAL